MQEELAYAVITPYTIRKSRTGAVLARFSQVSSTLVAAQMFAPDREFAYRAAESIQRGVHEEDERLREAIREYVRTNFAPDPQGRRQRLMMLVYRGKHAVADIARITGHIRISDNSGESIRDAYGDLFWNPDGSVRYFEPSVLIADSPENAVRDLKMWAEFAKSQPALLEGVCTYQNPEKAHQALVLIKPDSWRRNSPRPGAIVDMFSRTGLRIIGCRLMRLSVAQALEFYGPVKNGLRKKKAPEIASEARKILEEEFKIRLADTIEAVLAEHVGVPYADEEFQKIIQFMTGRRPDACPHDQWQEEGDVPIFALVYEGEDAVRKIRKVLGPTDPTKAPYGTVRAEFGNDVMVNTAHASDSPENAQREIDILKLRENNFAQIIEQELERCQK